MWLTLKLRAWALLQAWPCPPRQEAVTLRAVPVLLPVLVPAPAPESLHLHQEPPGALRSQGSRFPRSQRWRSDTVGSGQLWICAPVAGTRGSVGLRGQSDPGAAPVPGAGKGTAWPGLLPPSRRERGWEPGWGAGQGPAGSDTVSPQTPKPARANLGSPPAQVTSMTSTMVALNHGIVACSKGRAQGMVPVFAQGFASPSRLWRFPARANKGSMELPAPGSDPILLGEELLESGPFSCRVDTGLSCVRVCLPEVPRSEPAAGDWERLRVVLGWGRNLVLLRGAAPAPGIPAPGIPAPPRSLLSQALPPQVALRHFGARLVCPGDFVWLLHAWKVPRDSKTQSEG